MSAEEIRGAKEFYMEVAKGTVSGHEAVIVVGHNPDCDSAAVETIWEAGGLYVAPTVARTHQVVSTDANDTSAGTGARTVSVSGLDTSYLPVSETVILNGVSNVATSNTYLRINDFSVATAGSGAGNAGVITATADTDATVTAHIAIGHNVAQQAVYTVPSGKTAFVVRGWGSVTRGVGSSFQGEIQLRTGVLGVLEQLTFILGMTDTGTSAIQHPIPLPFPVSQTVDLCLGFDVSVNDVALSGGFDLILVDN